jgi:hypothetical protein
MEQIPNFGDTRSQGFCVHCGGPDESKDHIPSKVLLDEPFPENMHVCACCFRCNNDLSADEEYLACFLECVLAGDADPAVIELKAAASCAYKECQVNGYECDCLEGGKR